MAESKFDRIFQNARPAAAEPDPEKEKTTPHRRPGEKELVPMGGAGKTVAAAVQAIAPRPLGRPPGKRSDPAWKQFSVLLKKETQRAAANILREQDQGQDFSGLVQNLVESWIKRQKP